MCTQIGRKSFKVHLEGYNLLPFFKGDMKEPPCREFIYWNDDGQLVAIRYEEWKAVFLEQNNEGMGVWQGQFTNLRVPKLFNLRADPFERGDQSILYNKWMADRAFVQAPMQEFAAKVARQFPGISTSAEACELQSGRRHAEVRGARRGK